MPNVEPIREHWAGDRTRAGSDIRQLLEILDRTRALLADAEAGLAKARREHGFTCLEVVYWNDGEDEAECELVKYHASPHFDGEFWFDDHRDQVPAPAQQRQS